MLYKQCKAPLPWDTCTHFNAWQFGLAGKTLSTFQKDNFFPHCSFCSHHAWSMCPFCNNLLASRSTEKAQCQEKDKSTPETRKCLRPFHSEADLPWMGAPRTDVPPNETESQASQPPSIHIKTSSTVHILSPTLHHKLLLSNTNFSQHTDTCTPRQRAAVLGYVETQVEWGSALANDTFSSANYNWQLLSTTRVLQNTPKEYARLVLHTKTQN